MSDLKTSLLVNRQVPEFVRDEHPNFILFLEAYYEFLDQNGYGKGKDLRYLSDVDESLDEFEQQFYNTFMPFISRESALNKEKLIKNILPLYLAKGSEKSYRLLFRMLFNEEIQVEYPRNNILRASDGRWTVENIIRVDTEIFSRYVSDGIKAVYYLPYEILPENVEIFVDGVINTDYLIRKETKKLIFTTVPEEDSVIEVYYRGQFDLTIFDNRQLIGTLSQAKAIVEKVGVRNIAGSNFYQIFLNERTISGNFNVGETLEVDVFSDDNLIPLFFQTSSDVIALNIIEPGSNYRIGDSLIFRGSSKKSAIAIVDEISTGNIFSIFPRVGNFGAGYAVNNEVYANTFSSDFFEARIDAIDSSGTISPNTIVYDTTVISDFQSNVISDGQFVLTDTLANSLSLLTLSGLGPAINVAVTTSLLRTNTTPTFIANSTLLFDDVRVKDLGSLGTMKVINGGSNYKVGEKVRFENTFYFSGQGAEAVISSVNPFGAITFVTITNGGYGYRKDYPPRIVIDTESGSNAVLQIEHLMGEGALFDFVPGDGIQGKILSVKLLDPGVGYNFPPIVDMGLSGDGNAIITSNIRESFIQLPGKWTTSDSILSTDEIRLQGRDYYINFSYVITSKVEFDRYKNIVKSLLNPAGFINYAKYNIVDEINTVTNDQLSFTVDTTIEREIAGTVNVTSNQIQVDGTNTYFVLANTLGLLSEGSYIFVNSEIRIVNSIINNTTITVSQPYTYSANDQLISLRYFPYRSITTEYWRELAITIEGDRGNVLITEEYDAD
jgi:hypothetical protein